MKTRAYRVADYSGEYCSGNSIIHIHAYVYAKTKVEAIAKWEKATGLSVSKSYNPRRVVQCNKSEVPLILE